MVQSIVKSVVNLVSAVEENQQIDFHDFDSDFQSGANWITHALESCKRQIIAANGLEEESRKRRKAGSLSSSSNNENSKEVVINVDKENSHPNVVDLVGFAKNGNHNQLKGGGIGKENINATDNADNNNNTDVVEIVDIDVMSLKVAELRKHLRERGLDTAGLKKILQKRLQKAINDENAIAIENANAISNLKVREKESVIEEENEEEENEEQNKNQNKNLEINDVEPMEEEIKSGEVSVQERHVEENNVNANDDNDQSMQSVESKTLETNVDVDMNNLKNENQMEQKDRKSKSNNNNHNNDDHKDDVEMLEVVIPQSTSTTTTEEESLDENNNDYHHNQNNEEVDDKQQLGSQKKTFGQKLLKATRKVFSPNKIKNSPKKGKKMQSPSPARPLLANSEDKMDVCDEANPQSTKTESEDIRVGTTIQYQESSSQPSSSEIMKSENNQNEEVPKTKQSNRSSIACNMTEDEIKREVNNAKKVNVNVESSTMEKKEKPVKSVQSTPALSTKKAAMASSIPASSSQKLKSMKEARQARLNEIRNKVHSKNMAQYASSKTTTSSSAPSRQIKTSSAPSKQIKTITSSSASSKQIKAADANNRKREIAQQMRQKVQLMQHQEKKPLSPMETYEMSDRDESDSDESDYDESPKKKIPTWAQRDNLRPALEKQFLDGPYKLDPDEIFPEVSSCDLEAIFDQKKKRYIKRTSSGNWTKDKVTITEKLVYKRKMGFKK